MDTNQSIHHFLTQCAEAILNQANDGINRQGAARFSEALKVAHSKTFQPQPQPVLKHLDNTAKTPYTFGFHELAADLKWRPSPRTDDNGHLMALAIINDCSILEI